MLISPSKIYEFVYTLIAFTLVLTTGVASADQRTDTGFYLAGGVGHAQIDSESGFAGEETTTAPRIAAGWQLTPSLGIEAGYYDFKDYAEYSISTVDISGLSLAVVAQLPLSPRFALFAKVGQIWWGSDFTVQSCSHLGGCFAKDVNLDERDNLLGLGLSYELSDRLELELEYDYFDFKFTRDFNMLNNDVSFTSLSLVFEF